MPKKRNDPPAAPSRSIVSKHRECRMQEQFREDLAYWIDTDRRTASRLRRIVEDVVRDPSDGLGKPEPLRHQFQGCWSRRLTEEHRIVYRVTDDLIDFLLARYHY